LLVRAVYYLLWNTAPDQSAFEHNIVQDVAFLTFFLAGVVSPFTFILMCNDRYNAKSLVRTQELADKNVELEEASRVKGQFLATMSHELRTPLNGVIGFLGQLGKTRLDERQKEFLQTIDLSARMLLGVINDILDFSKIEAEKLVIEKIDFDLREFLDELITMFSVSAGAKGIELIYVINRDVPTRVVGDPLRLTQILSNLLSNAIKFTDNGEVLLEVRLLSESESKVSLEILVSDTGMGISQESLDRLFQPFTQADASTTRKHGGTGLGLIIAKRLVEMMGGSIKVESKVWHGTRFYIHLNMPKQTSVVASAPVYERFPRLKMLIVSPNPNIGRSAAENISILGIGNQVVNSGLAAMQVLKDASEKGQGFDAVIFDEAVNDIQYAKFAENVKTTANPQALRLILLSHSSSHAKDDSDSGGISCIIGKPIKFSLLYHEISGLFSTNQGSLAELNESLKLEENNGRLLEGKLVLIVDDNKINQKLGQFLVADSGGNFDLAENGMQAVDACSRKGYDLILMDVNMPVMDGLEATKRIRVLESGSRRTPIIALTANALPGDREKFIACGMDDYLSKPVNEKIFLGLLGKLFSQEVVGQKGGSHEESGEPCSILEGPALDPLLGIKLSFGDADTWNMVLGLLLDDLPEYSGMLSEYKNEIDQLSYVAHKIAGSSCYCGTAALHHAAKQLEINCSRGDTPTINKSLTILQQQIDRLRKLDAEGKLRATEAVVF
jgi:signal transduction histidine kinase/CheY-like chemotaxis protein